MNRRLPRVVTGLCAAVVSVAAFCVAAPPAFADAPATVYVDAANGSNDNDCSTADTACQTITQALQIVADNGTVDVGAGQYTEDLAPQRPVTIAGTNATLDGTLDIGAASAEITGLTFTGTTSPQVHIADPSSSDTVTIHGDTFTGSDTPAAIVVENNAAGTSITDNTITGTADGVDLTAGGSDSQYTITGNHFSLAGGAGTAIALVAADPDQLGVVLGSNSGTIAANGHAVTRSSNVTVIPTATPNSITSAGTSLVVPNQSTLSLITEQDPKVFDTVTTSDLDLTGARYDVSLHTTTGGVTAGDVHLQYSTDDAHFTSLDLTGGSALLPAGTGIPADEPATVYYRISVDSPATADTITLSMAVEERDRGQSLDTVAGTQVTATVQPNNDPTALPQSVPVSRNGTVPITLTGSDSDVGDTVAGFTIDDSLTHGTVVQSPTGASQVSYTAPPNFSGSDTFAFSVTDNHGNVSATAATVTLTIGANTAPSAADISVPATTLMSHAGSNSIDLSGGPSDSDGDSFTYYVRPLPPLSAGTVSVIDGHTASYTPAVGTAGGHAFEYRVSDGDAYSNWAVVSFTVDTPPVAAAQQGLTISHTSTAPLRFPC